MQSNREAIDPIAALTDLRVTLTELEHRMSVGKLGGSTPALLAEVDRLAKIVREAVSERPDCLPRSTAVRIRATLDAVDALRNRIEPSA